MTDVIAGRFALCDPIARGGSGVVWRAWDRKTGRLCAAKVLRRRDAGDLLRFVREQSVRVNGPHVLTPYSWAAEDAHVVIASELVDGGSLAALMGEYGPLAEPTVAALLDQLLDGLDNVHAAGLIHRDVKPANLLMRATGTGPMQALLSDFGLAVGAQDARLTQVGMVVGTPGYLPPELLHSAAAPHPVHDLYAAGQVAAALLNGAEPPQRVAPPDLSRLRPGPLRDLLAALTAPDPERRPQTARQARTWLHAGPIDLRPRTREGAPIEVRHQLPPLDAAALEASVPLAGPFGTVDMRPAPVAPHTTPSSLSSPSLSSWSNQPSSGPRYVPPEPPAPISPAGSGPLHRSTPQATAPRRRRRAVLITGAGAAVVLAVGVPVALAGRDSGTAPHPSRSANRPAALRTVTVGDTCGWQDQGDPAATSSGIAMTCALRGGAYVWKTRS